MITNLPDPRVAAGHKLAGVLVFICTVGLIISGWQNEELPFLLILLPLVIMATVLCSLGFRSGFASLLSLVVIILVFGLYASLELQAPGGVLLWLLPLAAVGFYLALTAKGYVDSARHRSSARTFRGQLLRPDHQGGSREAITFQLRQRYPLLPTSLDLISFPADVTGDEAGLEPEAALPEWSCPKCKEEVDGVLAVCWSCQTPRDSAASSPESFALDLGTWQRVFMQESGLSTASVQGSPFLGSAFATMASFITWDLHQHQAQIDWKDIAIGSLASTMLGSLAEGFFTPSRRVQSSRDRMAEALRQGVLAGDVAAQQQSYALYLRPFAVTGVFFEEEPGEKSYVPPLLPAFYARRNAEFEAVVSDIVWRLTIPLIALGRPGEAFGAGRLASSEKDWTADAAALIQGSDFLLVIPSSHEGTMWELRRILEQDILCHCIFLMPWQVKGRYSSRNWTETLAACAEIGLRLPPWESQGALFLAGRAGGWLVQQHLRELARATGMLELALLELMRRSVAEEDRPVVG